MPPQGTAQCLKGWEDRFLAGRIEHAVHIWVIVLFCFVSFFSSVYVCFPATLWTALCVLAETLGSTPKGHVLMCYFRTLMSAFFSGWFRQELRKMLFFTSLWAAAIFVFTVHFYSAPGGSGKGSATSLACTKLRRRMHSWIRFSFLSMYCI